VVVDVVVDVGGVVVDVEVVEVDVLDGVVGGGAGGVVVEVVLVEGVGDVGGGLCPWRQEIPVAVGLGGLVCALAMPAAIPMVGTVSAATTPRTKTRPRGVGVLIGVGASRSPCGPDGTGSSGVRGNLKTRMQDLLSNSAATCYVTWWIRSTAT
jgi:hypothetical protein